MEFLAGISVGILIGLVIGILLPEFVQRSNHDALQRETVREVHYLPAPQPAPPYPYQPPVIVLAAPRERTNNVVSVDRPTSALARR